MMHFDEEQLDSSSEEERGGGGLWERTVTADVCVWGAKLCDTDSVLAGVPNHPRTTADERADRLTNAHLQSSHVPSLSAPCNTAEA